MTATVEVELDMQGDLGVDMESMKGDLAKTERFLTADNELSARGDPPQLVAGVGGASKVQGQDKCGLAISQDMFASQHFCSVVLAGVHGALDLGKSRSRLLLGEVFTSLGSSP